MNESHNEYLTNQWKVLAKYLARKKYFKLKIIKNNYYVLEMFPYPSGEYIWDMLIYTLGMCRYKEHEDIMLCINGLGHLVCQLKMLLSENNIHPRAWTNENIKNMKAQLKMMGISYDWDKK